MFKHQDVADDDDDRLTSIIMPYPSEVISYLSTILLFGCMVMVFSVLWSKIWLSNCLSIWLSIIGPPDLAQHSGSEKKSETVEFRLRTGLYKLVS